MKKNVKGIVVKTKRKSKQVKQSIVTGNSRSSVEKRIIGLSIGPEN